MYPPTVLAAASRGAFVEFFWFIFFRLFYFSRPNSMVACLTAPRFEQTYLSIQISTRHLSYRIWKHFAPWAV
ncbi:MAG: hypothetical protein EOP10_17210 [Proteobacteria bacterium]|nr:MAG: hypothetical protein EOP10_17210 [Pseudomonadota bacterium]